MATSEKIDSTTVAQSQGAVAPPTVTDPACTSFTAAELVGADLPDPKLVVPGLIQVGLTVSAGPPKIGKSWLALKMAVEPTSATSRWWPSSTPASCPTRIQTLNAPNGLAGAADCAR